MTEIINSPAPIKREALVSAGGHEFVLRPLPYRLYGKAQAAFTRLVTLSELPPDTELVSLTMEKFSEIAGILICLSTDRPAEWLDTLDPLDLVTLQEAVIDLNPNFLKALPRGLAANLRMMAAFGG
jgi:hypothetical protein